MHCTNHYSMHWVLSDRCVFTRCCLVMAPKDIDPPCFCVQQLLSLLAGDGLMSWLHSGHWLLATCGHQWIPLTIAGQHSVPTQNLSVLLSQLAFLSILPHSLQQFLYCCIRVFIAAEAYSLSCCLTTGILSGSDILAFSRHVLLGNVAGVTRHQWRWTYWIFLSLILIHL
jgi:hypothetical protein